MGTYENSEPVCSGGEPVITEPVKRATGHQRRQYDAAYKQRVVEETLKGQDSVSVVARRHDINANMLFRWRREYQQGRPSEPTPSLIPISVHADAVEMPARPSTLTAPGRIHVTLSSGHQILIDGSVDPDQLQRVLKTLTTC